MSTIAAFEGNGNVEGIMSSASSVNVNTGVRDGACVVTDLGAVSRTASNTRTRTGMDTIGTTNEDIIKMS